jgi:hypothetical protein
MASPRDALVIDLFGLNADEVRVRFPAVFQWVVERVKPERDAKANTKDGAGYAAQWWLFGKPRQEMRRQLAGLHRYIATVETAKHRTFQFLDASVLPDNKLIAIASDDAAWLGVLSSQIHVEWALAAGSWLGVGNDPVYVKSRCFETFPFPHDDTGLTPELTDRIRHLAEQIDAHRKARQAAFESVTLTGLYNLLDKLRRAEPLSPKEKVLHEQGLVSVLRSLHDELDAAVLAAYGWSDLGPVPWADEAARAVWTEAVLERLVALNARRAAEEAAGTIRWLRPDFQDPARRAEREAAAAQAVRTSADELLNQERLCDHSTLGTARFGHENGRQRGPGGLPGARSAGRRRHRPSGSLQRPPPRPSPGPPPCPSRCAPSPSCSPPARPRCPCRPSRPASRAKARGRKACPASSTPWKPSAAPGARARAGGGKADALPGGRNLRRPLWLFCSYNVVLMSPEKTMMTVDVRARVEPELQARGYSGAWRLLAWL